MSKKKSNEIKQITFSVIDTISSIKGLPSVTPLIDAISIYRDRAFKKKLIAFIKARGKITDKQKIAFLKKLEKNPEEFHEEMVLSIDRLDSEHKAIIYGKLFKAAITNQLKWQEYLRLSSIIEKLYMDDLWYFLSIYGSRRALVDEDFQIEMLNKNSRYSVKSNLARFGLLKRRTWNHG